MNRSTTVDETDKDIMRMLQMDARLSYRSIAKALNLSTGTVSQRVKRLTDIILRVAWATGVIVIGGTLVLVWRSNTRGAAWNGLFNGAVLTAGILAGISAYILVGWRSFFTRFHELLFPPGSWTFAYSQTLIRLFPERLWFDVGVLLGVGTLVEAILIGLIARWLGRRHQGLGEHQKMN